MGKTVPNSKTLTIAAVILDTVLDRPLDYFIPDDLLEQIRVGKRVLVPLQKRLCKGTIFQIKKDKIEKKLLPIQEILPDEPIPSDLMLLAEWMSRYYCCPLSKVLKCVLPGSLRKGTKQKVQLFIKSLVSRPELLQTYEHLREEHPTQAKVLEVLLQASKGMVLSELLEKAGVTRSPINTLIKKKILTLSSLPLDPTVLEDQEYFLTKAKKLNQEQQKALDRITHSLKENCFVTHLIHGVTGSGKTEIYLQAIEYALQLGKGAIFLVPEIALTSQTLERIRSRFTEKVALLHHRLSDGQRNAAWQQLLNGKCQIAIGARSAIFSPVAQLGLIVVDEEHEASYKQSEETPCYHARDIAVMRGKMTGATVLLGSATPSLESYQNALKGKYQLSSLRERADHALLPEIKIVDMRFEYQKTKGFTLFSETLLEAIKKRLSVGEQVLLFLNRRGYHTFQICQKCAFVLKCPRCEISLTFHRNDNILSCHLCNYQAPPSKTCPKCLNSETLRYKGAGTENVQRALHAIFPEVRTFRLDADTTKHKGSHELFFKQFRSGKADVLIGTQMIAKGLHFPAVTLVGVLNADASLNIPDFRASEQVFQLLTQVAGRSGRGALKGEVIIQTHLPDHSTIQLAANQDFDGFFSQEIAVREFFKFPPFCHLVKFVFSGKSAEKTQEEADRFRRGLICYLPQEFELHPVVPCGHAKIKDLFRYQFLMKGKQGFLLKTLLDPFLTTYKVPNSVHLFIDVDPLSTYF
jgi:primosomal protein N' (replication factor Y)